MSDSDLVEIRRDAACGKIPSKFKKIAEAILNGHFLVTHGNDKVEVYPTSVEIYWHEEQGDIKDYIVYHRNSGKTHPAIFEPHGRLHNHVSGIDITFEQGSNPKSAIRASALIRAYKVTENGKQAKDKPETRSTYLYDDLYGRFSIFDGGFSVEWKDDENACNTISDADCTIRHNVSKYKENNGKMEKDRDTTVGRKTANGKYVQDERRWRFTVSGDDTRFRC